MPGPKYGNGSAACGSARVSGGRSPRPPPLPLDPRLAPLLALSAGSKTRFPARVTVFLEELPSWDCW